MTDDYDVSIYVHESGDGVSYTLITTFALSLSNPVNIGMAGCTPSGEVRASVSEVSVQTEGPVEVPYTINTDEIEGGVRIITLLGGTNITDSETVRIRDPNQHITWLGLVDANGDPVADDFIFPGGRTEVVFNAENSVRGALMWHPIFTQWPIEDRAAVWQCFEEHPRFDEAVQFIRDNKRVMRAEDPGPIRKLFNDIAEETGKAYLEEKGIHDFDDIDLR